MNTEAASPAARKHPERRSPSGSEDRSITVDAQDPLGADLDRLSLEQALKDFEIANGRVIDLTQRLIAAQALSLDRQREIDRLAVELGELGHAYNAMRRSRAFRTADRYWAVLGALRR